MSRQRAAYTAEQSAAITTRGVSIGLSAGAGCGKTFVLTERFLTQIEPGRADRGADLFSHVVAITFTDRAAREMRDRIRSACAARLKDCEESDVPHWLSIFRRIDGARISTIHSFCAGFLRRHAVAAAVDPRFRLLEVETGDTLARLSIVRALRRLLEQGDESCIKLVAAYGLEGTRRALRKLLAGYPLLEPEEFHGRDAAQFAAGWRDQHQHAFLPGLVGELGQSAGVATILELLTENEPSHAAMCQRRALLLDRLNALRTAEAPPDVSILKEIREAAQVRGGGTKKSWASEDVYEAVKTAFSDLREQIDKIDELAEIDPEDVARAAELSAAAVPVMEAVAADYTAAKAAAGLLDFDDLLVRTRALLRGSDAVRKEAAGSIAALMVDEFQDTDPVQAEIVRMLAGGSVASGRLFVVGDKKQSIYRFRGADPTVFDEMRQAIPDEGRLPLTRNFRSQPEILKFVNALFAAELEDYERLVPHLEQRSPPPSIEFLFAIGDADAEEVDSVGNRRRREADWMARRIQELLHNPTPRIPEKDAASGETTLRPVKAGDIAILFRALTDVGIYEDAFRRAGVDYYLFGGRAFFAQQEVYDVVNLCTFLNDPADEISLVGILRSPFFSLSDETLFLLADGGRRTLRDALEAVPPAGLSEPQQEQVRLAARVLGALRDKKDRLPLANLLQLAIEQTGYDASLLHEFLGRRKIANLRKLVDMARQFDRSALGTLPDFVLRLRESVTEEAVEELAATHPEASDVVRLMTIHQAKGLEFPVVIVADMDRPRRGSGGEAAYHRELGPLLPLPVFGAEKPRHIALTMSQHVEKREDEREALRILYVALTRAADHLILSAGLPAGRRTRSPWIKLLERRFDLATGLPHGDPYLGTRWAGKASRDAIPQIRVHLRPPDRPQKQTRSPRPAPLAQFREIVEHGEAIPLPPLMQEVAIRPSIRLPLSVSAIEQADAFLRGQSTAAPILDDPFEEHDPEEELFSAAWPRRLVAGLHLPIDAATPDDNLRATNADQPIDATLLGIVVHNVIELLTGCATAASAPRARKKNSPTKKDVVADGHDTANSQGPKPQQVAAIINAALRGLSPLDAERVPGEAVKRRVQAFLDSELWTELRGAERCFREVDFLLSWPAGASPAEERAVISGKLDCLARTRDGKWKIIDYKTGGLTHTDPAALFEQFGIQLVLYAEAVRALIGRDPDSIEIVAVGDEIRRYPLVLWDEFQNAVRVRIDESIRLLSDPEFRAAGARNGRAGASSR